MAEINYVRDYGIPKASTLWVVLREGEDVLAGNFPTREKAEGAAGDMVRGYPGCPIHILAVIATVQTSPEIVGTRFDPSRVNHEAREDTPLPNQESPK